MLVLASITDPLVELAVKVTALGGIPWILRLAHPGCQVGDRWEPGRPAADASAR